MVPLIFPILQAWVIWLSFLQSLCNYSGVCVLWLAPVFLWVLAVNYWEKKRTMKRKGVNWRREIFALMKIEQQQCKRVIIHYWGWLFDAIFGKGLSTHTRTFSASRFSPLSSSLIIHSSLSNSIHTSLSYLCQLEWWNLIHTLKHLLAPSSTPPSSSSSLYFLILVLNLVLLPFFLLFLFCSSFFFHHILLLRILRTSPFIASSYRDKSF